jgi:hypothetical protein
MLKRELQILCLSRHFSRWDSKLVFLQRHQPHSLFLTELMKTNSLSNPSHDGLRVGDNCPGQDINAVILHDRRERGAWSHQNNTG